MARRLDTRDADFARKFEDLLFAKREVEEDVAAGARRIIAEVRSRGDAALVELTNKFDRAGVTVETLRLSAEEIGVSQMHFSRLLNRTLDQLRASLEEESS